MAQVTLGNFLKANPGTNLENFSQTIGVLKGSNDNYKQGVHWMIRDVARDAYTFGGRTLRLESSISNARRTTSYIDVDCPNCDIPNLLVEYKSGPGSITSKTIKEQLIERDLFNAESLNQIQWRMEKTGMSKEKLVGWLEENMTSLNNQKNRKMFESFGKKKNPAIEILDEDDLMNYLKNNDDWYILIFKQ